MSDKITLAHGAGGEASHELIESVFLHSFGGDILRQMNDSAICEAGSKIAFTTDSFVVTPRFFPGGDIGRLSVCGTVNDLSVSGAKPKYISCAMIIEEGFSVSELKKIALSMAETALEAGVSIVTGDTKVVGHGGVDGIIINTAGIGVFEQFPLSEIPMPGDAIIVSGCLGCHGMAVLCARQGIGFTPEIASDAAPLNGLAEALLSAGEVSAMRDPTRGGIAATLCEWAHEGIEIEIDEQLLPVRPDVKAACALLGFDVINVANEGVIVACVPEKNAEKALEAVKMSKYGENAAIVGKVREGSGAVLLKTVLGSKRRIFLPRGELLPRIC